jgi:hypothetical protein
MKFFNSHIFFKILSIILIILSIIFFFYGFLVGENSAGAGGLKGDFNNVWTTLQTFLKSSRNYIQIVFKNLKRRIKYF